MKTILALVIVVTFVAVECGHTFLGTNVMRPMLYHHDVKYSSKTFAKRIENLFYQMPKVPSNYGRSIQGILVYDLTNSGASANITQGGIGFNYTNIRMKSDRGQNMHFDVFIYA